jgi:hypothetical protein
MPRDLTPSVRVRTGDTTRIERVMPMITPTYHGAYTVNRDAILTPYRLPRMPPLERTGSWPDAV